MIAILRCEMKRWGVIETTYAYKLLGKSYTDNVEVTKIIVTLKVG